MRCDNTAFLDRGNEFVAAEPIVKIGLVDRFTFDRQAITGAAGTKSVLEVIQAPLRPRPGLGLGWIDIDDQPQTSFKAIEYGHFF
jgi:hypothetical protein